MGRTMAARGQNLPSPQPGEKKVKTVNIIDNINI